MSQAHNRITAYHWYLGSAFWRERREHINLVLTVQKVFIDHHTRHGGCHVAPDRRAAPAIGEHNIAPPGVQGSKPTGGTVMGVCRYAPMSGRDLRSLRNGGDKPTMQTRDDPFCTAKRAPCAVPSREFAGGSDGHRKCVRVVRAREQKHR